MSDWIRKLKESLKDKEYRDAYVESFLNSSIATQVKVLREQRGWTQTELAERAGMKQPRISVMEDVNYESWSIDTLKRLAEAFDVTLCVSFEIFGKRLSEIENFSRETLQRVSFDNDPAFKEREEVTVSAHVPATDEIILTLSRVEVPAVGHFKQALTATFEDTSQDRKELDPDKRWINLRGSNAGQVHQAA